MKYSYTNNIITILYLLLSLLFLLICLGLRLPKVVRSLWIIDGILYVIIFFFPNFSTVEFFSIA